MIELIIDFENRAEVAELFGRLGRLRKKQRITIVEDRKRRSDRQNRYYHPCFCQPLADFMNEQEPIPWTKADAHEFFKRRYLSTPVFHHETGELLDNKPGSTTDLSTVEFNAYLDRCAEFLWDYCHYQVPPPGVYHERDEADGKAA